MLSLFYNIYVTCKKNHGSLIISIENPLSVEVNAYCSSVSPTNLLLSHVLMVSLQTGHSKASIRKQKSSTEMAEAMDNEK